MPDLTARDLELLRTILQFHTDDDNMPQNLGCTFDEWYNLCKKFDAVPADDETATEYVSREPKF